MITNRVNGKRYIGQSSDIEKRWGYHISSVNSIEKNHYPLYVDMRGYGIDNFDIEVLEEIDSHKDRSIREYELIKNNKTLEPNGYNKKYITSEVYSKKLQRVVSRDELYHSLWENTFEYAGDYYGVTSNTIRNWCKKYGLPSSSSSYENEEKSKRFSEKMSKIARDSSTTKVKVAMLDKDTKEVLKVFDSMQEASEYVGANSRSNIYSAIHNVEGRKTCKGYAWKYV